MAAAAALPLGPMRNVILCFAALVGPAFAQEDAEKASRRDDILAALDLPAAAQSLRDKGVDKGQVKEAVQAAKGKKLKAREARDLMKEAGAAVDEHGPVDNFGAFVKGKLDSGLRGRELAAAIKAEHVARGKGKGHGKKGPPAGKADDKEHGQPSEDKGKGKDKEGRADEEGMDDSGSGKGKPEKEDGGGKGQGGGKGKGKGK